MANNQKQTKSQLLNALNGQTIFGGRSALRNGGVGSGQKGHTTDRQPGANAAEFMAKTGVPDFRKQMNDEYDQHAKTIHSIKSSVESISPTIKVNGRTDSNPDSLNRNTFDITMHHDHADPFIDHEAYDKGNAYTHTTPALRAHIEKMADAHGATVGWNNTGSTGWLSKK